MRTRVHQQLTRRLRFDGYRLRDDATPEEYGMESGDLIDAFHDDR